MCTQRCHKKCQPLRKKVQELQRNGPVGSGTPSWQVHRLPRETCLAQRDADGQIQIVSVVAPSNYFFLPASKHRGAQRTHFLPY